MSNFYEESPQQNFRITPTPSLKRSVFLTKRVEQYQPNSSKSNQRSKINRLGLISELLILQLGDELHMKPSHR